MDFLEKNKKVIITMIIIVVALLVYLMFFAGGSSDSEVISYDPASSGLISDVSASISDGAGGRDLLVMLSRLHSISLDTSIFSDEVFMSLDDKSRPIGDQPLGKAVGRRNPFSDFGSNSQAASAAAF